MMIMNEEDKWIAVKDNNSEFDDDFVYALKTTGIFCRPSCKSRLPKRENVVFYKNEKEAKRNGFRACLKCFGKKDKIVKSLELVKKACHFIENESEMPSLQKVADYVGVSPFYFQKQFISVLDISPRQFADANRQKRLKNALKKGDDILGALYEVGYGSSSRVYEFAGKYLGMTPRVYKKGGESKTIWFTILKCNLGCLVIAATEEGICSVKVGESIQELKKSLKEEFHSATLLEGKNELKEWTQALINYLDGKKKWPLLPYDVQATAFQRKVWEWLRTIPPGKTYNYSAVAKAIGNPQATRAVARACATNPVLLVIPCHRILPKAGGVGGYRAGSKRKEKLLSLESK